MLLGGNLYTEDSPLSRYASKVRAQEAPALVALVAGIKCCRAVVEDLCAEKVSLVWVVQNVFRCAPLKCIISHQSAPGPQQLQAFKSNSSFGVLACVHTALSPTLHTMQWPRRPHGFSSSLPSCSAHKGPDLGHNSHYAVTRTSTSPEGMAALTAVTGRHRPSRVLSWANASVASLVIVQNRHILSFDQFEPFKNYLYAIIIQHWIIKWMIPKNMNIKLAITCIYIFPSTSSMLKQPWTPQLRRCTSMTLRTIHLWLKVMDGCRVHGRSGKSQKWILRMLPSVGLQWDILLTSQPGLWISSVSLFFSLFSFPVVVLSLGCFLCCLLVSSACLVWCVATFLQPAQVFQYCD